jgi:alkaline phosphatase D
VRQHNSGEIFTLDDYRNRYGPLQGRPGPAGQPRRLPWVVTWDDHEVENNYAGLVPQDAADAPTFAARRAVAYQAWWEHQPVRMRAALRREPAHLPAVDWGGWPAFHVLDSRQYRTNQACGTEDLGTTAPTAPTRPAPARRRPGGVARPQPAPFARDLRRAGQPGRDDLDAAGRRPLQHDQWDGYAAARTRLLDQIRAAGPTPTPWSSPATSTPAASAT